MKYGGDKIKVVTDGLSKGDDLQALAFDTCGYLLIGKRDDSYGTRGDPLVSDDVPCGQEGGNCPTCQEKVDDIIDLPGRPSPCSDGDAFLMLSKSGKLKVLCKENFECEDNKVGISEGDETPGYLKDKLRVCNSNSPITLTEKTAGEYQYMCIGWDSNKAKLKFTDLTDTPDDYENQSLVISTGNSIDYFTPSSCADSDFAYLIYRKGRGFESLCPRDTSVANWILTGDYPVPVAAGATWSNHVQASAPCELRSTDDIKKGTGSTLFQITRPGIYILTLNSTLMNDTDAWLKAARGGLTINGNELGDAKYCSRDCTPYVNENYPDTYVDHTGKTTELELGIMSFNTSYVYVFDETNLPANIGFAVKLDCRVAGAPNHTGETPPDNAVACKLTSGTSEEGPRTFISAVRVGEIPATYKLR